MAQALQIKQGVVPGTSVPSSMPVSTKVSAWGRTVIYIDQVMHSLLAERKGMYYLAKMIVSICEAILFAGAGGAAVAVNLALFKDVAGTMSTFNLYDRFKELKEIYEGKKPNRKEMTEQVGYTYIGKKASLAFGQSFEVANWFHAKNVVDLTSYNKVLSKVSVFGIKPWGSGLSSLKNMGTSTSALCGLVGMGLILKENFYDEKGEKSKFGRKHVLDAMHDLGKFALGSYVALLLGPLASLAIALYSNSMGITKTINEGLEKASAEIAKQEAALRVKAEPPSLLGNLVRRVGSLRLSLPSWVPLAA